MAPRLQGPWRISELSRRQQRREIVLSRSCLYRKLGTTIMVMKSPPRTGPDVMRPACWMGRGIRTSLPRDRQSVDQWMRLECGVGFR